MQTVTPITLLDRSENVLQPQHFLRCSVCGKQHDASCCRGNSYGVVCRDCLAGSGDMED